eukprot:8997225-Alexandrium_andersonii.AAC.1
MQHRFRCSKLELRGPKVDLKFHPRQSRRGDSASFCAALLGGSGGAEPPPRKGALWCSAPIGTL